MKSIHFFVSCEHAGTTVPAQYQHLFKGREEVVQSHRGWDSGAWDAAQFLASAFDVPVFGCHVTRLLIEANRSLHSEQLFSEFTRPLADNVKETLIQEYFLPYRHTVEAHIQTVQEPVLHLSVHSFTPELHGEVRQVDIGLLFDPERKQETEVCMALEVSLKKILPGLVVKFNEPYKGTDDGFTTHLRTLYDDERYRGIEIELNQKYVHQPDWAVIKRGLRDALKSVLQ